MKQKIVIVTSAYGTSYLKKIGGQEKMLDLIQKSGADGIEIRRELLSSEELLQLPHLAKRIKQLKLACFYSVPFGLFKKQSIINPLLDIYFHEAALLNATLLKFSLGSFNEVMKASQAESLKAILASYPSIQCVIENDQEKESGNLSVMKAFATAIETYELPLKLAFDCGNWYWVNEDPTIAAKTLSKYIGYIHIKATQLDKNKKRITIPPTGKDDKCLQLVSQYFPNNIPQGIEFPLIGDDLLTISRHYVDLLKE